MTDLQRVASAQYPRQRDRADRCRLGNDAQRGLCQLDRGCGRQSRRQSAQLLPDVHVIQPSDVANAVAWLVSEQGRYVTGVCLPVDAGFCNT